MAGNFWGVLIFVIFGVSACSHENFNPQILITTSAQALRDIGGRGQPHGRLALPEVGRSTIVDVLTKMDKHGSLSLLSTS